MVTEQDIDAAVDFLHRKADAAAEARAQAEHLDEMRHVILSRIASQQNDGSEAERQRIARASQEYQEFLEGLKAAREKDYTFRNKRAAAQAKLDYWRSKEASRRGADRVG